MTNEQIDKIVNDFLVSFNKMCVNDRKDLLERERTINYEHGSRIKKYRVTHRIKKKKDEWLIEAVSNGFWIFKRKFPLLRIVRNNNRISFYGMFTYDFPDFELHQLKSKLDTYLSNCKKQSYDTFTKS
ncbi:hypothetical protein SAMN04489761_0974 [Tenacibaculum sp. MAR_2009_124]|uniref:hypothetical protein n=1 Tax=Tenacibaculum sp. MAR_2009_124 TaxID=1250059 RepID=UPI0008950629|nr:hypothetical protein [Tenacibaculum sp. MAR_2009_124]SEB48297.1 hypothetical protein SAMN04489761_0974 [Tenacibaculum sp. MAR_2009_124]